MPSPLNGEEKRKGIYASPTKGRGIEKNDIGLPYTGGELQ